MRVFRDFAESLAFSAGELDGDFFEQQQLQPSVFDGPQQHPMLSPLNLHAPANAPSDAAPQLAVVTTKPGMVVCRNRHTASQPAMIRVGARSIVWMWL